MNTYEKKLIKLVNEQQLDQLATEDVNFTGELVDVEIDTLKRPDYSNRVQIPNLLKIVIQSLSQYDFLGGIFVGENSRNVIDGVHRAQIWKAMGHTTIPCYLISCNPEQEKGLHLKLNTQASSFNPEDFGVHFSDLQAEDFGIKMMPAQMDTPIMPSDTKLLPKPESAKFFKISTNIPAEVYNQFMAIKEASKQRSIANTIIHLVKFYNEKN